MHLVTCDWNYGFEGRQLHPLHLFGKEASAMLGHLEVDLFMGWRKCAARKRVVQGQKKGGRGARADEKVHFSPLSFVKSGIRMQRKEKEDEDGEMKRMSWEWDRLKLGDRVRD